MVQVRKQLNLARSTHKENLEQAPPPTPPPPPPPNSRYHVQFLHAYNIEKNEKFENLSRHDCYNSLYESKTPNFEYYV